MPFHVICLETKRPYLVNVNPDIPAIFTTGEEAATVAESLTRVFGRKHKPQRIKSDPEAWKQRERERFNAGIYTALPWANDGWWRGSIGQTTHFAHVSKEKPGMIAFTESEEKGEADIRTRIKPGTYLERFYGGALSKDSIQKLACYFAGKYETSNVLKFATTADEIAHVYINGPRSCMSGPETGLYQSPFHPTRVYAAGDLAVAYLERGKSIVARSVVWPEKKLYVNVYGDYDRMGPLLRKEGYKQSRLDGAKLKRIEHKNNGSKFLVVPHIDCTGRVTDMKDHLVIGGDVPAASTCGLISCPDGTQCNHCHSWGHERALMRTCDDTGPNHLFCTSCYTHHTYLCRATNVRYGSRDRVYIIHPGYWWSVEHFHKHGAVCAISGNYYPKSETTTLDNGTVCATTLLETHTFTCASCNKRLPIGQNWHKQVCQSCMGLKSKKKAGW